VAKTVVIEIEVNLKMEKGHHPLLFFLSVTSLSTIVEHEGRNCAIPGRFKIFPLLRLNFSLRENSKHITSVDIAIAERGNRSGYPERSGK